MEIKAKGKLDFKAIKALTHLTMFKKANPKKSFLTLLIILTVLTGILVFEMIFFSDYTLLLSLTLSLDFFLVLLLCYSYFLLPKITYKSMAKMKDAENEYIFYDGFLKGFTKINEYNAEARIEYSSLVKVYETSKYLFLYQTKQQAYIVDKSTIEGGTVEEIRNNISAFLKDKYIICKY